MKQQILHGFDSLSFVQSVRGSGKGIELVNSKIYRFLKKVADFGKTNVRIYGKGPMVKRRNVFPSSCCIFESPNLLTRSQVGRRYIEGSSQQDSAVKYALVLSKMG